MAYDAQALERRQRERDGDEPREDLSESEELRRELNRIDVLHVGDDLHEWDELAQLAAAAAVEGLCGRLEFEERILQAKWPFVAEPAQAAHAAVDEQDKNDDTEQSPRDDSRYVLIRCRAHLARVVGIVVVVWGFRHERELGVANGAVRAFELPLAVVVPKLVLASASNVASAASRVGGPVAVAWAALHICNVAPPAPIPR